MDPHCKPEIAEIQESQIQKRRSAESGFCTSLLKYNCFCEEGRCDS